MWEGITSFLQKALIKLLKRAGAALLERTIDWIELELIPLIRERIDELD